jgi:hypothetical protein
LASCAPPLTRLCRPPQVDKIFKAAALAANAARIPLAKLAAQETGMGVVEDKVIVRARVMDIAARLRMLTCVRYPFSPFAENRFQLRVHLVRGIAIRGPVALC